MRPFRTIMGLRGPLLQRRVPGGVSFMHARNFSSVGQQQFSWMGAAATICTAGALLTYLGFMMSRNRTKQQSRSMVEQEVTGTPKLGGPFTLYDRQGRVFTDKDLRGKYALIYFGFSFCPDICPEEMEKQAMVIERLDKKLGELVTPVFITCDPMRDTVAQVNDYCKDFHPRLVGLTGTTDQVKKVTRSYRVYFNEGLRHDGEDYLVDHSIIHYLLNPKGKFLDFYGKNLTADEMTKKMEATIREDVKKHEVLEGVEDL
eukprot:GEMP01047242.1.p1 GENE.GEMP01047242.1~~GEMP01047242.1.p1  ORF type:complete len:259 (-),score=43.27 GEMP01047242.1:856-1632(-)